MLAETGGDFDKLKGTETVDGLIYEVQTTGILLGKNGGVFNDNTKVHWANMLYGAVVIVAFMKHRWSLVDLLKPLMNVLEVKWK